MASAKMTRTRLTFNSREEWLEARKDGIGASEVATIVGLNPWETPYQLWRRKIGLDPAKPMNAAMNTGHILEDGVAQYWAQATGREIIAASKDDFMFIDKDRPYLRVSPDRTFWIEGATRNDDNKGILECKTTRMKVDPDDIPKYWFCQVQMNLGVAGYTQGSLAWLSAGQGFNFGFQDLMFVPEFYDWLVYSVSKFWKDNIEGRKEPDAVNVADVLIKYNRHTGGKIVECSDEVFSAYQDLKVVKKELDALKERKEALEATLKMAFQDAEALSYGGDTIATWKAPKPSNKFDDKAFIAEHPDLAAPYTHQVQGARRLLLK